MAIEKGLCECRDTGRDELEGRICSSKLKEASVGPRCVVELAVGSAVGRLHQC